MDGSKMPAETLRQVFITAEGETLRPDEFRYLRIHENGQITAVKTQTGELVFSERDLQ